MFTDRSIYRATARREPRCALSLPITLCAVQLAAGCAVNNRPGSAPMPVQHQAPHSWAAPARKSVGPVKSTRTRPKPKEKGCLKRDAWLRIALTRQKSGIEQCFRITKIPNALPPPIGRVTVDFEVDRTGEVVTALLVQSKPTNPRRNVCLMKTLRGIRLPRLCRAPLALSYSFNVVMPYLAPRIAP